MKAIPRPTPQRTFDCLFRTFTDTATGDARKGGWLVDKSAGLPERQWQVLLLGGPSGVGKTTVSYRLARHFDIGITEVDDFQALLERMTTAEQQPAIHFWRTHPAPEQLSADEIIQHLLEQGEAMRHGLEAVIANHLEASTPVVLEGDFIPPALAAKASFSGQANGGRVRGAFLFEPDEQQLVANYLSREPAAGPQVKRAHVSWLHGLWLRQEAERYGLPVVLSRPWDSILERLIAALA
jgi:2-phosphoglycerate kinase